MNKSRVELANVLASRQEEENNKGYCDPVSSTMISLQMTGQAPRPPTPSVQPESALAVLSARLV